jgi:hypothetical protein
VATMSCRRHAQDPFCAGPLAPLPSSSCVSPSRRTGTGGRLSRAGFDEHPIFWGLVLPPALPRLHPTGMEPWGMDESSLRQTAQQASYGDCLHAKSLRVAATATALRLVVETDMDTNDRIAGRGKTVRRGADGHRSVHNHALALQPPARHFLTAPQVKRIPPQAGFLISAASLSQPATTSLANPVSSTPEPTVTDGMSPLAFSGHVNICYRKVADKGGI